MLRLSLDPLCLAAFSTTLDGEELSQVPMPRLTSPLGVRTSKPKRFDWRWHSLEYTEHDGYTKLRVRS
jgi:hypothetical protein